MKVSLSWLKELVELKISDEELIQLLPLRSVSIKEVVGDSIELDMKGYNRADLLSMRGVALEVSAINDSKVKFTEMELKPEYDVPKAKVNVENPDLAPVYSIAKIENLKVEQSNETWRKKLLDCGIRSINNVIDVTNLIMMEYGQPLHAFDARAVKDEAIIVRTAREGERITTLDGKTRDLETQDLLITDSLNALGIAGVMGGKDSEIADSTTTILLEAAIFDPVNIRKTATRLGLQSEASKRFQHGLTKKRLLQALNAAIKMYEGLGGRLTALTMVGDLTDPVKKVGLTQQKLNSLIGVSINPEEVENHLMKLGFKLRSHIESGNMVWEVAVPYWRLDINIEEDLIEEVARLYGYEKIPAQKVSESQPLQKENPIFKKIRDLRQKLIGLGLTEIQTYSFYSTDVLNALSIDKEKLIKVANPISLETEYLRQNIWPNLVESVGKNIRQGYKDIAIFEIGKAYYIDSDENPKEDYRMAIALFNNTDNPLAELYQLASHIGSSPRFAPAPTRRRRGEGEAGGNVVQTQPSTVTANLFHPTRQIDGMAEVHLRVLNKLGIEQRVAILEIEIKSSL